MGNLTSTTPFTELWERLLSMGRIDSPNNEDFARGIINDVYTRVLPRMTDWHPIINSDNLTMVARYNTGTLAVDAAGTTVTGTGTTWTTVMVATDGYKIKIAGNDNVYTFTYVSATSGTISPALSGADDLSGKDYEIFKDEYELNSAFNRLLKNGSVYVYSNGRLRDTISEVPHDMFRDEFRADTIDPIKRVMLTRTHSTNGTQLIRVNPPPQTAKVYPYEYIERVSPMTDYQTGDVSVTSGSTAVVGTDTKWAVNVSTGDYFRVDNNGTGDASKWYKIATVTDNTNIVLSSAYGEETESGMEYTASSVPSAYPHEFHEFLLYEGLVIVVGEQGDRNLQGFALRRNEVAADLKKNFKARRTNVQFRMEDGGYR